MFRCTVKVLCLLLANAVLVVSPWCCSPVIVSLRLCACLFVSFLSSRQDEQEGRKEGQQEEDVSEI